MIAAGVLAFMIGLLPFVRAAAGAPKRRALPGAPGKELKRTCGDFRARRRNAAGELIAETEP